RLPVIATLSELDEEALIQILTEPKNSLTKQYGRLFEMEGVELEFRTDALKAIAQRALKRKTGARGLRSILENVLLDTMYEIPSIENVSKVVIDENVISGNAKPLLIYESAEQPATAIPEDLALLDAPPLLRRIDRPQYPSDFSPLCHRPEARRPSVTRRRHAECFMPTHAL